MRKCIIMHVIMYYYYAHTQSLSRVQGLYLNPDNIEYYATYLHSSADIQDRVIRFGPGTTAGEKLLEVPIGHINFHATIVITVGLDKSYVNTNSAADLRVGLSDGTNDNIFYIYDYANTLRYSCSLISGSNDNDAKVNAGTQVPSMFKLTLTPFTRFGTCETGQEGGYIVTGRFTAQMQTTKPLFLRVHRDASNEQQYIHYLKVDVY